MFNLKSALYFGLFNAVANLFVFLFLFLNVRTINLFTIIYFSIACVWTFKCYTLRKNWVYIMVGYVPCIMAGCVNYFYSELHLAQFLAFIPGFVVQGMLFSKWKPG